MIIRLHPGGRTGAMPLRSAQTGHVVGGIVIQPRFGWSGVGRILSQIGWHASPQFVDLPLVPGSGREVPPWVLAGPVLMRLSSLLKHLHRGYRYAQETLSKPRGHIVWNKYISDSLSTGRWHHIPCRYPELSNDPYFRSLVKWCLERVRMSLTQSGGYDSNAGALIEIANRLIEELKDVNPIFPHKTELDSRLKSGQLDEEDVIRGLEAMGWIVDERGLGGGRELDGLAWYLTLSELWEQYVETVARREAALIGAEVRVGRLGETTFPIRWNDSSICGLSHLIPDIVMRRGSHIHIVDAKYKAHFAELDEKGWRRLTEESRETHRADFHQIMSYAALFDAKETTVTLVYPLRKATFEYLAAKGKDIVRADMTYGGRLIRAELRGLPFGVN